MKYVLIIVSCSLLFINCKKKGCTTTLDNRVAPDSEIVWVQNHLNSYGIQATKHASGAYYRINSPGTGAVPGNCAAIRVNYSGKLTDGTIFDEAIDSNNPISLSLSNTIYGWRALLPLLMDGGNMDVYIPPTLGYGPVANGSIPANSVLIFNISLKGVANP